MKLLSIGEIAKKVDVASHTIRFWTEEFEEYIKFEIGKGERRYYPEESIATFNKIKNLIHFEGIKIKTIKEKKLLFVIIRLLFLFKLKLATIYTKVKYQ